jgi:hypothetical protein
MERPDVAQAFAKVNGWTAEVEGFSADFRNATPDNARITYILDDGQQLTGEHLTPLKVSLLRSETQPSDAILQGIDVVSRDETTRNGLRHRIETDLIRFSQYTHVPWIVMSLIGISLIVASERLYRKRDPRWIPFLIFVLFTLLLLLARVVFYSIIDAASWNAEIRYLVPANALGVLLFSVCAASVLRFIATGKAPSTWQAEPTDQ